MNIKKTTMAKTQRVVFAGTIAAIYLALVILIAPFSFGPFQFRIAEVLTVLPFLFPETIPGLFVGCILSNLMFSPYGWPDVVFGSLATLTAAYLTYRCKVRWMAPLPPIIINAVVVGTLITLLDPGLGGGSFVIFAAIAGQVAVGQVVVCAGFGIPVLMFIQKMKFYKGSH